MPGLNPFLGLGGHPMGLDASAFPLVGSTVDVCSHFSVWDPTLGKLQFGREPSIPSVS